MKRARLNREQVLAAGAELADEQGLEATTLAALAARVGIRTPSLYKHVDSHAALVEGIATAALADLHRELSTAVAGRSGPPAVHAAAAAYRAYAHAHPGRYAAATAVAARSTHEEFRAAATNVLVVLQAALRHWELTADDEVDAIRGLRATLHGFVTLERAGGFGLDRSPDASFEALIDSLIAGLDRTAAANAEPTA